MFLLIAADWLGVVGVDCIGSEIPSSSVLVERGSDVALAVLSLACFAGDRACFLAKRGAAGVFFVATWSRVFVNLMSSRGGFFVANFVFRSGDLLASGVTELASIGVLRIGVLLSNLSVTPSLTISGFGSSSGVSNSFDAARCRPIDSMRLS